MGLKALALSVMESDRGENARKLRQTEGARVENKVGDREIERKNWTQLRKTDWKKWIFLIK